MVSGAGPFGTSRSQGPRWCRTIRDGPLAKISVVPGHSGRSVSKDLGGAGHSGRSASKDLGGAGSFGTSGGHGPRKKTRRRRARRVHSQENASYRAPGASFRRSTSRVARSPRFSPDNASRRRLEPSCRQRTRRAALRCRSREQRRIAPSRRQLSAAPAVTAWRIDRSCQDSASSSRRMAATLGAQASRLLRSPPSRPVESTLGPARNPPLPVA